METPLICANEQVDNEEGEPREGWTKLLRPFVLDTGQEEPALPASAFRGMNGVILPLLTRS